MARQFGWVCYYKNPQQPYLGRRFDLLPRWRLANTQPWPWICQVSAFGESHRNDILNSLDTTDLTLKNSKGRLKSFQSNYNTCRNAGARYQVILAALWGSDGIQGTIPWPGDGGNWSAFDDFLGQVISFIKSNNMQSGLEIDIWNEPDSTLFWNASYSQYLQAWTRAHKRFK